MINLKFKIIRLNLRGRLCGTVVDSLTFNDASRICTELNHEKADYAYNVVPQDFIAETSAIANYYQQTS